MPTETSFTTTYKIQVCDESGFNSLLETGISTMYKKAYLQEHIKYLQECNPTKSFQIYAN